MGNGEWGMGNGELGIGHRALGIGHICSISHSPTLPLSHSPTLPLSTFCFPQCDRENP
ncbi:MAG: hypothetical protein QQW96_20100 [Tychonema bourrellyi B0820]|nr:hypothetical protein [Tychonema bourrellyi B0820]